MHFSFTCFFNENQTICIRDIYYQCKQVYITLFISHGTVFSENRSWSSLAHLLHLLWMLFIPSRPFQPPCDVVLFLSAPNTTGWRHTDFIFTSDSFPEPFLLLVSTTLARTILCVVLIYYVLGYSMMLFPSLIFQRFLSISGSLKSPHLYFLV